MERALPIPPATRRHTGLSITGSSTPRPVQKATKFWTVTVPEPSRGGEEQGQNARLEIPEGGLPGAARRP